MRFDNRPESIFFIGVTGGSCSGKNTFARRLQAALGESYCSILSQDCYYRDQSACFDHDGGLVNFDDPASIDFDLLYSHLLRLQSGHAIDVPVYDFITHQRRPETHILYPTDAIIVEGSLILTQPSLVALMTESVFLECPEEVRLARRLQRDVAERGRSEDGVLAQFFNHVKPMHIQYIEPCKNSATYCVHDELTAQLTINELVDQLGIDS